MSTKTVTYGLAIFLVVQAAAWSACRPALAQGRPGTDFRDIPNISSSMLREQAAALIDAIGSADSATIEAFLERYATEKYRRSEPPEARLREFRTAHWRMGEIELRGERLWHEPPAGTHYPLVRDRTTGVWWYLALNIDESAASRITGFTYQPITAPTFVENVGLSADDLSREVNETVARACERDAFSGAVLVAQGANILATAVCGEASKTFDVPITLETKFNLASMNKMFTALAVMQLVERGRLSLSDTVDRFLDETWLPKEVARRITIAELLSHRSGLGDFQGSGDYFDLRRRFMTVDSLAPIRDAKLAFEPGSGFRYSNSGAVLLGAVIEAVTGDDYYAVIRREIYEPAGMKASDSYAFDAIIKNVAVPYEFDADNLAFHRSPFLVRHSRGTPAGGGYSTVLDLHKFAVALLQGKLVAKKTLESMWTDYSGFGTGFYGYGYGFEIHQDAKGRSVGHGGSAPGVSTNLEIRPDSGYVVVVLANYSNAAVPIARRLSDLLPSK